MHVMCLPTSFAAPSMELLAEFREVTLQRGVAPPFTAATMSSTLETQTLA